MSACRCEVMINTLRVNIANCEKDGHPQEWRDQWINNMAARVVLLETEHELLHVQAVGT
jgi:hypothetical protein